MALIDHIRTFRDAAADAAGRLETYALGTALMVLIYHDAREPLESVFHLAGAAALILRPVRNSTLFWLVLGVVILAQTAWKWANANNHDFLLAYWCMAIGLAAARPEPLKILARSGALLIGLVFTLAMVWKLVTPDYRSGDFFEGTILADSRFGHAAYLAAGLEGEHNEENSEADEEMHEFDSVVNTVTYKTTDRIRPIAFFVTYWTILIEGLIALAFLAGRPRAPAGPWILIVFSLSTDLIAPVVGFGANLMLMAAVGTERTHAWTRLACLAVFILLPTFDLVRMWIVGR